MPVSKKASLLVILLIGIVGVVVKFLLDPFGGKEPQVAVKKDEIVVENVPTQPIEEEVPTPAVTPQAPAPTPVSTTTTTPAPAVAKKVSVNTSYGSPAGEEAVSFSLTVDANGMITAADTTVKASDEESVKYQKRFQAGLPGAVVGKKLSSLSSIDKVGKASLTTNAFNKSLLQLKAQL